jgi:hypothetical protein
MSEEIPAAPQVKVGTSIISVQNVAIVLILAIIAMFVYKKFLVTNDQKKPSVLGTK